MYIVFTYMKGNTAEDIVWNVVCHSLKHAAAHTDTQTTDIRVC